MLSSVNLHLPLPTAITWQPSIDLHRAACLPCTYAMPCHAHAPLLAHHASHPSIQPCIYVMSRHNKRPIPTPLAGLARPGGRCSGRRGGSANRRRILPAAATMWGINYSGCSRLGEGGQGPIRQVGDRVSKQGMQGTGNGVEAPTKPRRDRG